VQCPGTITVHASNKSFTGPTSLSREMNSWPTAKFDEEFILLLPNGEPAKNRSFVIAREDGSRIRGRSDAQGRTGLQKSIQLERIRITILPSNT